MLLTAHNSEISLKYHSKRVFSLQMIIKHPTAKVFNVVLFPSKTKILKRGYFSKHQSKKKLKIKNY